ncbi:MAG: ferritin [Candidatus Lokiarchaeota archaeon]|nr:ferritin [Candidatus Lokiarchaeota archaeon]
MINEKLEDAINKQINRELYSAYLYLSMAAWFETKGYSGFANWMQVQFEEETFHAMKFFNYINERGGRVKLMDIEAPPKDWESPLDAFKYTYEHETKVTALINNLMKIATEENDYAAISFLNWYVDEQVEEEANASELVEKLKMTGKNGSAIFMLDKELAARVFNPPASSED